MALCDDSAGGGLSVNPEQFFVSSKEERFMNNNNISILLLELGGLEGILFAETVRCQEEKKKNSHRAQMMEMY